PGDHPGEILAVGDGPWPFFVSGQLVGLEKARLGRRPATLVIELTGQQPGPLQALEFRESGNGFLDCLAGSRPVTLPLQPFRPEPAEFSGHALPASPPP